MWRGDPSHTVEFHRKWPSGGGEISTGAGALRALEVWEHWPLCLLYNAADAYSHPIRHRDFHGLGESDEAERSCWQDREQKDYGLITQIYLEQHNDTGKGAVKPDRTGTPGAPCTFLPIKHF